MASVETEKVTCSICYDNSFHDNFYGFEQCYRFHSFCEDCLLNFTDLTLECPCDRTVISNIVITNNLDEKLKVMPHKTLLNDMFNKRSLIVLNKHKDVMKDHLTASLQNINVYLSIVEKDPTTSVILNGKSHLKTIRTIFGKHLKHIKIDRTIFTEVQKDLETLHTNMEIPLLRFLIHQLIVIADLTNNIDEDENHEFILIYQNSPKKKLLNLKRGQTLTSLDVNVLYLKLILIQLPMLNMNDFLQIFPISVTGKGLNCLVCFNDVSQSSPNFSFENCTHKICNQCFGMRTRELIYCSWKPSCPICCRN